MGGETENQTGKVKNEEDTKQPNPHESWKKYCRLTHTYTYTHGSCVRSIALFFLLSPLSKHR